jgi:hypothetical protein
MTIAVKAHVTPRLKRWVQRLAAEKGVTVSKYLSAVYQDHIDKRRPSVARPTIEECLALPKRRKAIYLIKLHGVTKIGKSVNPELRVKNMQLPGKPEWVHIHWVDDADKLEKELHQFFATSRRHGEWFALSDAQVSHALRLVTA